MQGCIANHRRLILWSLKLIRRLYTLNKDQLILLLNQLTEQHTTLANDILSLLNAPTTSTTEAIAFPFSQDELITRRLSTPNLTPQNLSTYRQQISTYQERLTQGETQQAILDELILFLQGIELTHYTGSRPGGIGYVRAGPRYTPLPRR